MPTFLECRSAPGFETRSRIHLARLQIRERLLVTLDALSRDLPVEEAIPQHGA